VTEQRFCTSCGAALVATDHFCGACGAAVTTTPESPTAPAPVAVDTGPLVPAPLTAETTPPPAPDNPSVLAKFPMWQAVLFTILSGGLWGIYWVYRVRREQCRYLGREDDAVLQAFGSIIPIWNCFVVRNVWREADAMIDRAGTTKIGYRDFTIIYIVLYAVSFAVGIVGLGIPVLYVIVQSRLNAALDRLSGGEAPTMRFTFWSLFWIILPLILLVVLAIIIVAVVAALAGV
jgi:hypothetical protein